MATFPTIYVINLKRTPERRLHIQRQLDAFNLNYQFVNAIDKFDLKEPRYRSDISRILGIDEADLEYKYSKFAGVSKANKEQNLNRLGHLACLLSHVKTYNLILENNNDIACVLEDDAIMLPTFPEVLETVSIPGWDILMLSSHSSAIGRALEKFNGIYRRIIKSYNYVLLIKWRSRNTSHMHEHISELLDISPSLYPEQSKAAMKILENFINEYKNMVKLHNREQSLVWLLFSMTSEALKSYKDLIGYTARQLGGLPAKHSRQVINDHHCIAEPAERPTSGMAYLVKRSAVKEWKSAAISRSLLAIDSIPWRLHGNRLANLRIVSPPCVVGCYDYQKHSLQQKYKVLYV